MMQSLKALLLAALFLGTLYATGAVAQEAAANSDAGYAQTPVQTIVQIAITAVILKIMSRFDLP